MKRTTFMLLFVAFMLGWGPLKAQQKQVTGVVMDEDHNPLPGASILEIGTNNGTTTGAKGLFTLSVANENATLKVSFIGYVSQNVSVKGKESLTISLEPSASGLNEVVVVGYGTQKKVDLTGSVSTVSGKELAKRPVMRASAALEGLASGVTVRQTSGQPGGDGGTIRVRGIGTLGNSNPLVLIDGVEGSLDGVDPNNIESISVLKDAAAASIYGSRAANGVILVTTKKGTDQPLTVNYNAYFGWQRFTALPEFVDGYTFMKAFNQAYINDGRDPLYSDEYLQEYKQNYKTDPDHYPNTNWQKLTYNGSGFLQHHNLQVTGGSKQFKIMGSIAYQDQKGKVAKYKSKRYSFRVNTEMNIKRNFQLHLNLYGRHSPITSPTSPANPILSANRKPPIFPAILSDGRFAANSKGVGNPLAQLRDGGLMNNTYETFRGTIQANYQPINGMDIEFNYTPQYSDNRSKKSIKSVYLYSPDSPDPVGVSANVKSSLRESDSRSWKNTLHFLVNYKKSFSRHYFKLLLGYEQISYQNKHFFAFRDNFPLQNYEELNAGSVENWQNGGTGFEWALRSVFGRLNYNFRGKYLLQANLRRDGSSRFASGHKYGLFPSFSVGWRVKEENFLKNIDWLSTLKLRGSWGELGNQLIGNYPFISVINLGVNYILDGIPVNGGAQTSMANENISWETTQTKDVGIDIGLFRDRLNITYDYYIRNTTGILLQLPIPYLIGLDAPYQNAGVVKNTGWDLTVNYKGRINHFRYNVGLNLSDVKNEVIDLKGTGPYISAYSIVEEEKPINSLFGYKAIGLFQSQEEINKSPKQQGVVLPGDIKYKDINKDGVINDDDRQILGNQIPRYTFGLNLSINFKGLDAYLLIQGVGKRKVYLYSYGVWAFYNGGTIQKWQLDYWMPDNLNAKYPTLHAKSNNNNFQPSSWWVYNAAYVRLKSVQFGYSFPEKWLSNSFFSKVRVYVSGDNIFTLDQMLEGWDPEMSSGDGGYYPLSSTYTFGIDLSF